MRFADPWLLLLLAFPAALAIRLILRRREPPPERLGFPPLAFLASEPTPSRARWRLLPDALRIVALALLILALARPQVPHDVREVKSKARNLMLALDISSSMKATDFKPGNRLAVARETVREFVRRRQGDLVGLVIFAGRAFLQAPLTPDTDLLQRMLGRIDIGMLPDGTAIGTALTPIVWIRTPIARAASAATSGDGLPVLLAPSVMSTMALARLGRSLSWLRHSASAVPIAVPSGS